MRKVDYAEQTFHVTFAEEREVRFDYLAGLLFALFVSWLFGRGDFLPWQRRQRGCQANEIEELADVNHQRIIPKTI